MNAVPIRLQVTRYQCPHCTHRRANKAAIAEHMGCCWHNPGNRTCKTCVHLVDIPGGPPCEPGVHCNCNDPHMSCGAGLDLPLGPDFPVVGCPSYEQGVSGDQ